MKEKGKSTQEETGIRLEERTRKRDIILGHRFNTKDSWPYAPCYSQSLLLADFKEYHTLL
jgi:hypothetical protein